MKKYLAAILLGFVLMRGQRALAQKTVDDLFKGLEKRAEEMRRKEKEKQKENAEQFRRQMESYRSLWLMMEGNQLLEAGDLAAADARVNEAARLYEKKRPEDRTSADVAGYRNALLHRARVQAALGNAEEARTQVQAAWKIHEASMAARPGQPRDDPDEVRTCLVAATVLLASDRPEEAAPIVKRARAAYDRMAALPDAPRDNALRGEVRLLESRMANQVGNYQAAQAAGAEAEVLYRKRFPSDTHPKGDPQLAAVLVCLAMADVALEENEKARLLLVEAEKILDHYKPRGKPLLAEVYRLLGHLQLRRGQVGPALDNIDQARQLYEELFPDTRYRRSHPALIQALVSLADLLNQHGRHDRALSFAQAAWQKCRQRYAKPHEQTVATLLCYGRCFRDADHVESARDRFAEAIQLAGQLGDTAPKQGGRLLLALAQLHLGSLHGRRGDYRQARTFLLAAQEIYQRDAPEDHPHRFASSCYLGLIALQAGDREGARTAFAMALDADRLRLGRFLRTAAQVEDLTFAQPRQVALHGFLCATSGKREHDGEAFARVWAAKQAATRLAEAHYAALRLLQDGDPRVQHLLAEMVDACAGLRQELLAGRDRSSFARSLAELDRLERELTALWPRNETPLAQPEPVPHELAARLPSGSAFLDFVRHDDFSSGRKVQPRYVAFLVLPGQAPRRIELGPAEPIDQAVQKWRESMERWNPATDALRQTQQDECDRLSADVRQLVWEPIVPHLPAKVPLLLLAPDGNLARFPFAALPGSAPGKILLQESSIGYVPNGPFLLRRLLASGTPERRGNDRFLALGAVDYGAARGPFAPLAGSRAVIELAQKVSTKRPTQILEEATATVDALLHALPEATEAHLATHGFFDEKGFAREREQLEQMLRDWPRLGTPMGHAGAGRRFPLSFVGVALAGANDPATAGRGGGILTGEGIPLLRLAWLQLILLDACETGLGQHTGGEAVQGLQLAFHLSGCPNVVATLWHVKDATARVLTDEFYRQRWRNRLPTLEALRQAQLALYLHPVRVPLRDDTRSHLVMSPLEAAPLVLPTSTGSVVRGHPQMWGAAYVHSGVGHPFVEPTDLADRVARLTAGLSAPADAEAPATNAETFDVLRWLIIGLGIVVALLGSVLVWRQIRRGSAAPDQASGQ